MSKTKLPPDAIKAKPAAKLIGVSAWTIRRWVMIGRLAGFRVGSQLFVSTEDVLAQVERVEPLKGPALETKAEKRAKDAEVDKVLREAGIRR